MARESSKKEMREAYLARNAELSKQIQEQKGVIAALIKQRDEALEEAKERGEKLAAAEQRIKELEKGGFRAEVRTVSGPEAVAAKVKVRRVANKPAEQPFGKQVQAAMAHFLRDSGLAPIEPRDVAWDRAYKINGALLNGPSKFTLDEIMGAVGWLEYSLGERRYSVEQTRRYLQDKLLPDGIEPEGQLFRAAQCELELINLASPMPEQKTDVRKAEAANA